MKTISTLKIMFVAIVALFLTNQSISAQSLTREQKIEVQNRVKQKVEEFQSSLSKIVDNSLSHKSRKEHVSLLLKLFIGEGEPYSYYDDELDETIKSTGVKMETSSVYRTNKQTQKVKKYIYKLYNPETGKSSMQYSKIVIESANAVRVDNIERVGDHYECVAYFYQKFIGYNSDGRVSYSDITGKKIKCYINSIRIPGVDEPTWDAKLGDIYVMSTQKL